MAKLDTKFCDPPFNEWRSSISSSSRQSYATDEGYYSDDKQRISWMQEDYFEEDNSINNHNASYHDSEVEVEEIEQNDEEEEEEKEQSSDYHHHHHHHKKQSDREIPILKSTRTIRITYTPLTYTLSLMIVLLSFHILITHPLPWAQTFPPVFIIFHFLFHITHLMAHTFQWLTIERHCVVYGTWLFWTGWLLGNFVFSQRIVVDWTHPTTTLFWLLMFERRNAWGILVWEYVGRLDQNIIPPSTSESSGDNNEQQQHMRWYQAGSIRLLAFRIWCLLGTGSFWGLLYLTLAKCFDGYSLLYLLQFRHILQLLFISAAGGLMMIIYWSFWTFQYRGILWQKELRKGIVVWYSDGLAFAGDVE
ncbi:hypothetical protein BJ944DRAFT_185465 [Cunninghamella echinulata]|nr:hypothetical protein BJ944DRAFT_185465 [Cunninghamella echinulata]